MALRDKIKQYDKKYGMGTFYKFREGQNQIRILAEPEMYDDVMDDQPKGSFITYAIVLDPDEGESLVVINTPMTLVRWLGDEQELSNFSEFPMPYDVMLKKTGTGLSTKYQVTSRPQDKSMIISGEMQEMINSLKPIRDLANAMEDKKRPQLQANQEKLPAEVVEKHNLLAAQRNKTEMNATYVSYERGIGVTTDPARLDKALELIEASTALDDLEKDFLKDMIKNKRAELASPQAESDIKVEDIPF